MLQIDIPYLTRRLVGRPQMVHRQLVPGASRQLTSLKRQTHILPREVDLSRNSASIE
jgi:hypothetical protein